MSRQKNSINNLLWGILGNLVTSVVAIVIPRLFIVNYGSEVNGLLSSIRQIYVYLALLEVGVGDASVVALYGPIGRRNYNEANQILAATDKYYKKIGVIYAVCVAALGFIYPLLLKTTIPYLTCCLVIILQGSGNVISYLVQGKYNMLLRVDNRNYVTTNLSTATTVLTDIIRIILLLNGKSIIEVQATYLVFNLIKMIYISWYIKKNYKWLDLSVEPNYEAISQRGAVFMHQISSLVFNHTDVLILTFVCGLKTVSIYSLYATIYGMVNNIISIASNSVQSALGQIFNSDRKKYMEINEAFETYYLALVFSLFAIASIFIIPFMKLYTSGADVNYIDWKIPVLFGIYQLLNYGRVSSNFIIGFAGEFKSTQWRAWLETIINLTASFICVFKFGIYGVLFGTITALIYRANDIILFANHHILERSAWPTYRRWITNIIIFIVTVCGFSKVPMDCDSYLSLILNAIWVSILVVIIFFSIDSLVERSARHIAWKYMKSSIQIFLNH
ncbi:lipopolysaccharide biosynthesis protein [Bariatricus sp. HCP28S3_D3]|uniref:lipopolysaccharide biosynthesis protein n=1 Tax=Bariatricus sp. HCP28S3_D3 TaxID=3438901 RepID=UPI003F8B08D9